MGKKKGKNKAPGGEGASGGSQQGPGPSSQPQQPQPLREREQGRPATQGHQEEQQQKQKPQKKQKTHQQQGLGGDARGDFQQETRSSSRQEQYQPIRESGEVRSTHQEQQKQKQKPPQQQEQPPQKQQQQQWPQKPQHQQQQPPPQKQQQQQWPQKPQQQQQQWPQKPEQQQQQWPQKQQQQQQQQQWPQKPEQQQQQQQQPQQVPQKPQQQKQPQQQRPQQPPQSPLKVPPAQQASEYDFSKAFDKLAIQKALLPHRKGKKEDCRGRRAKVETNHLALNIKDPNAIIYHYDVEIVPDKPVKYLRPAVESVRQQYFPQNYPAFDGKKNIYSYRKLPIPNDFLSVKVSVPDVQTARDREFEVQIKYANQVNFSAISKFLKDGNTFNIPREALQALDVVLRNPGSQRFVTVGRSFFSAPSAGSILSLGSGMHLWYGFYQSTIIGWRPFLNVDVAHKGFPAAKNCVEILKEFYGPRDQFDPAVAPNPRVVDNFKSFICELRISKEMVVGGVRQKRSYKVNGVSECPRYKKFQWENHGMVSVEQYYWENYRYKIEYPLLPCLEVGSKENSNSLPMELCSVIEGQSVNRKLNEQQTREMVRAAAVNTTLRKKKIVDSINKVAFNNDPCIREFGLTVASEFTTVDARILEAPMLTYNQDKKVFVDKGVWRSGRFISTNPLKNWFILNADRRTNMKQLQDLARSLQENGGQLGMFISPPVINNSENIRDIQRNMEEYRKKGAELVLIILPDWGPVSYAKVKQIAEQQVGVLTQCLKSRTVGRISPSTIINILLKINSKHNGINHTVTCKIWEKYFSRPIIVFGADVTHPSPGQRGFPSIAAVAASYEPKAFSYNMEWRLQQPKEEIIVELEEIVKKQLLAFYTYNNQLKPEKIFFYRDGVSEGFFKRVLNVELQAIRRACKAIGHDYEPPITFLVVQKRHHTRFFPGRDIADGKNLNVPAGTVVDETITSKNEIDFYLVSHASIQGTSRPTKYHVLWDDSEMSEYDIEELTYYLCHLFTRCTRTVSYPAPTYYAHLAAFRVRTSYMEGEMSINLSNLEREEKNRRAIEQFVKRSPMYFI